MPQHLPAVSRIRAVQFDDHDHLGAALQNGPSSTTAVEITAPGPREEKINDVIRNGVSGILYKWVNYGKGWRPRWFLLRDGVLSYYKIHGSGKIAVNQDRDNGSKVIGESSFRQIERHRNRSSQDRRKPAGEVHLKVSSVHESGSDDKRFSIFTGTNRLHLRAETRGDRVSWMEALRAVKGMFPRVSNCELMAPSNSVGVSTEKLRQRLLKEGVREAVIQGSEQIMRREFAALQNLIVMLKQKQQILVNRLQQVELLHVVINRKHHGN